jgi:cell division initiation protein
MRITPLDVRKQEFRKAVRGFDCDEVRAFLSTLADEYEAVLVDSKQIREQVMEQDQKIREYQSMEMNLRDTLMTAERLMKETRENAGKEGDLILKDAEMKARQVLEECRLRTEELRRELVTLRKEKENYLARFKSLAEAQIQFVETHKSDFEDMDRRLVDIADTVVAGNDAVKRKPAQVHVPAPAPVTDENFQVPDDGPDPFAAVEPVASPAPAASSTVTDNDIWRDYSPGQDASEEEVAGSIADLVSESLAEKGDESVPAFMPPGVNLEETDAPAELNRIPLPTVSAGAIADLTAGPVLTNGQPDPTERREGDTI